MTPTGVATAMDGTGTCKGALHVTATGATDYSGFATTLAPAPKTGMLSFGNAVDVSAHKGISFKMKSGSGTPAAVYFDIKTKETTPMAEGGSLSDATTSNPDTAIGLRNNRGQILVAPWTSPSISTTYQTFNIPFGMLVPRWVPAPGSSMACPNPGAGVAPCQAPKFNPKNVLGIEFSVVADPGFPKPSGSTVGSYDLWIDDVAFIDDDAGVPTMTGFPLTGAGMTGMCTKPANADGKFLVSAYNQWKATFLKSGAVVRPENANDVVSEGIAYGMLIAVNFNDKTTFDSLYTYWKSKSNGGLMDWCQPSTGGGMGTACSNQGGGSATDADEDAAFALLQAGKVFGGTYADDAKTMIGAIWAKDIDTASNLPTGGSNYSNSTSSKVTNPSYFAPAYYRAFAAVDSGHAWGAVADKSISTINSIGGSTGLVPAWCSGNCGAAASNGASTDTIYQYDSHRTPMRVALDYCWNGTAAAKTYTDKTTTFFATNAFAGKDGIGRIVDLYQLNGMPATSGTAPNSASIIGTAAVGAMASAASGGANKQFLDDAYQAVFDMTTRGTLATVDPAMKTPYSYYNATVGLLTLLIMTGNFSH
jgi:endo-1,4-beta-D-glucanase Y